MENGRKMGGKKISEDEDRLGKSFCQHIGLSGMHGLRHACRIEEAKLPGRFLRTVTWADVVEGAL